MRMKRPLWPLPKALRRGERLYTELSFFGSPCGLGAAIASGKFLDASRSIDELLFASEKGMTSGTNANLDIATRRAGVIHRATCADHISLVIFWMDGGFHLERRAQNLTSRRRPRKV